jgi:hypothetical protein
MKQPRTDESLNCRSVYRNRHASSLPGAPSTRVIMRIIARVTNHAQTYRWSCGAPVTPAVSIILANRAIYPGMALVEALVTARLALTHSSLSPKRSLWGCSGQRQVFQNSTRPRTSVATFEQPPRVTCEPRCAIPSTSTASCRSSAAARSY